LRVRFGVLHLDQQRTGSGCTAQQLLGNPGFETGSISPGRQRQACSRTHYEGIPAQSGPWLVWLDTYELAYLLADSAPAAIFEDRDTAMVVRKWAPKDGSFQVLNLPPFPADFMRWVFAECCGAHAGRADGSCHMNSPCSKLPFDECPRCPRMTKRNSWTPWTTCRATASMP
jgi:hypothetical protein